MIQIFLNVHFEHNSYRIDLSMLFTIENVKFHENHGDTIDKRHLAAICRDFSSSPRLHKQKELIQKAIDDRIIFIKF